MPDGYNSAAAKPDPELAAAIRDAETLLRYAAQTGIELPPGTIAAIETARANSDSGTVAAEIVPAFYAAFTIIAAKVAPVTIDTLRVPEDRTRRSLRWNGIGAVALALAVVVFSGMSFVTVSMSNDIAAGIEHANDLALKLRSQVGPPADGSALELQCGPAAGPPVPPITSSDETTMIAELQDFASSIRMLLRNASKLDFFVLYWETSPLDTGDENSEWRKNAGARLELEPGLVNMRKETFCKISAYQDIRDFGQNVRADTLAFYGAISAYLLPVLYALLGAFAFNLRDFSERVRRRTYHPDSYANMARTTAAMTIGAIISLFNIFSRDAALQPLAIAFLAGYGVEAFFAFLDALLTNFGSKKQGGA